MFLRTNYNAVFLWNWYDPDKEFVEVKLDAGFPKKQPAGQTDKQSGVAFPQMMRNPLKSECEKSTENLNVRNPPRSALLLTCLDKQINKGCIISLTVHKWTHPAWCMSKHVRKKKIQWDHIKTYLSVLQETIKKCYDGPSLSCYKTRKQKKMYSVLFSMGIYAML